VIKLRHPIKTALLLITFLVTSQTVLAWHMTSHIDQHSVDSICSICLQAEDLASPACNSASNLPTIIIGTKAIPEAAIFSPRVAAGYKPHARAPPCFS